MNLKKKVELFLMENSVEVDVYNICFLGGIMTVVIGSSNADFSKLFVAKFENDFEIFLAKNGYIIATELY